MSLDRSTYVFLLVGVWLVSNKLLVSSAPSKRNLNDETELPSADVNSVSTKELYPLSNLYQYLQRETLLRTADVRDRDTQEDSIAQIKTKEDTYPKKFDTKQSVDKRQEINCDLSKVTLNMLVEYFKYRTLCGTRTGRIRYGLGK